MGIFSRIFGRHSGPDLSDFLGRSPLETSYREAWIDSPGGYRLYAHVHGPAVKGVYPSVVIVPGADSPGTDYDKSGAKGCALRAEDLASFGFTVLHYDPSGRGRSGGKEDYWGPIHQRELATVADYLSGLPEADSGCMGILSFSIGIIITTGALSRYPMKQVKYVFDWEGPSNRFNTTKNDTHRPLKEFPSSRNDFWDEREAASFIKRLPCHYFRYQAAQDHVQGGYKGHAIELINNAIGGDATWTRCNDNPENTVMDPSAPERHSWVPEGLNHRGQIIKYFMEVAEKACKYNKSL